METALLLVAMIYGQSSEFINDAPQTIIVEIFQGRQTIHAENKESDGVGRFRRWYDEESDMEDGWSLEGAGNKQNFHGEITSQPDEEGAVQSDC